MIVNRIFPSVSLCFYLSGVLLGQLRSQDRAKVSSLVQMVHGTPGPSIMALPTPTQGDGESTNRRVTSTSIPSYAKALKKSYPNITLDFECLGSDEGGLSQSILADFLFEELLLQKSEIKGLVMFTKGNKTVKIETKETVDVSERFGNKHEFRRDYGNKSWRCVVRGAMKSSVLRILGVPCEISNEDLLKEIVPFAKVTSGMNMERFGDRDDPRLSGWTNGNRRVMILKEKEIPDFLTVDSKRFRILHRDQIRRCFLCREEGHIKADCPSLGIRENIGYDTMIMLDEPINDEPSRTTFQEGSEPHQGLIESLTNENENVCDDHELNGKEKSNDPGIDVPTNYDGSSSSDYETSKRKLAETDITPTNKKVPIKRNKAVNRPTPAQTRSRSASACSMRLDLQ